MKTFAYDKTNVILFAPFDKPSSPDSVCTDTGRGYDALVCSPHEGIHDLFKALCLGSGHTRLFKRGEDRYLNYEMSCKDSNFFESDVFMRICKAYGVDVVFMKKPEDLYNRLYRIAERIY